MPITPTLEQESRLWQQGLSRVAGVDEVGRGCWAGPVVAAAVVLPPGLAQADQIPLVRDSKTLNARQRQALAPQIMSQCLRWGLGLATVTEIDWLNIQQATYLAMQRALEQVTPWDYALVDGTLSAKTNLGGAWQAIVRGDTQCYSIACAAILAKVSRDQWLSHLGHRYPEYGWERNKGYGTREHQQALQRLGVTPWHRQSFGPIRAIGFGRGKGEPDRC
ncbi:ribonuclease HII [Synechococcus sp. PCC 6312]|uniref:ribonuclease HII n=1 Tax=Synechococcus sp. (strain ATCC 27167 / PCC 6312) TaxID=195253 RepID=UPI00029F4B98|nr:ribonuclease HII [Synechococcus sp. PCC 6312]AFY59786.1 ribonuclease HII [Synechococcus sp. PCC 6312]